jgi:hypothetical protein
MRFTTLLLTSSLFALAASPVAAQTRYVPDDRPIEAAPPRIVEMPPPRVMEITPDDSMRAERYIKGESDVPVIEEHMTLRPGSIIPDGVPLRLFANVSELGRFAYFVSVDHKIVIADPQSRTVVRIIDERS